jgi:hypothetical protein
VFPGLFPLSVPSSCGQTYLGIPMKSPKAAYLDGCNKWQTFTKACSPDRFQLRGAGHLHCGVRLLGPDVAPHLPTPT